MSGAHITHSTQVLACKRRSVRMRVSASVRKCAKANNSGDADPTADKHRAQVPVQMPRKRHQSQFMCKTQNQTTASAGTECNELERSKTQKHKSDHASEDVKVRERRRNITSKSVRARAMVQVKTGWTIRHRNRRQRQQRSRQKCEVAVRCQRQNDTGRTAVQPSTLKA